MAKGKICVVSDNSLTCQAIKEVLSKKDFGVHSVTSDSLFENGNKLPKTSDVIVWEENVIRSRGKIVFDLYNKVGRISPSIFILSKDTMLFLGLGLTEGIKGFVHINGGIKELEKCLNFVTKDTVFISPFFSGAHHMNCQKEKHLIKENTRFTTQEVKILHFIRHNKTSKEIGHLLNISYKTVQNHRQNMCNKLGLSGRNKLYEFAKTYYASLGV